ncbi:MerR family transcriptional regulator [Alsobacter sp. SYSU M60028]|uniref:MerR family transcriptional regulator n=1 Tax=Alsobacter ponti TaxID=2962936 RepID=A0ABT1LDM6_9HYPH|nr:MerR family transcriptional regulator [Alsobacter ponti]MCP8938343.1 MerR family transcriptional regulator [Alsobacter ponti]
MDKSPDAFRTISEVSEDLDIPQHVLRFWETRFSQIKPLKRGGGRRYYRPDDVDLLRGIRHLLYGQGFTIRGVQRILKEQGLKSVQAIGRGEAAAPQASPADADAHGVQGPPAEVAAMAMAHDPDEPSDWAEQPGLPLADEPRPRATPSRAAALARLSPDALRRLGNALAELEECRRLLEAARSR